MKAASRNDNESGMALITVIMVLMLSSALMIGFFAAIVADQRANGIDRDQSQAYAAAHAGLEKLTSDLATKFETDFSPSAAEINLLKTHPPVIPGFKFTAPGGVVGSGYAVSFVTDAKGNPAPLSATGSPITAGPYNGFTGLITQYTITSTARSDGNAEVRLRRVLETVAVPVFQFGMFSETDLSFFAGPNFNFGGRIQTNGNLYLAEGIGNTLTLSDRVTTAGEVIRRELSNGFSTRANTNYTGTVSLITAAGVFRNMGLDEGSLVNSTGAPISAYPLALNELPINPGWTSISKGTYKSNIMSSRTGGKVLKLPLATQGANPIDLIVRPVPGEDDTRPLIYPQRYFAMASLRILLSDTAADIMAMPSIVQATAPVPLDGTATAAQYGPVDATHPPFATSIGPLVQPLMATTAAVVTNATVIPASNITANFPAQLLSVGGTAITCTGRDATHFYGCTNPLTPGLMFPAALVTVATATAVTGNVTLGGVVVAAATTLNQSINTARNSLGRLTVVSTAAFGPMVPLVWLNPIAAGAQPMAITCAGADNDPAAATWVGALIQLNGCSGVAANAPAATPFSNNSLSQAGQSLNGVGDQVAANLVKGFIKIEYQNAAGVWTDVTTQILNLGFAAPNQWPVGVGNLCADPSPNAVIRLQRLRDNADGNCYYSNSASVPGISQNARDYWPNVLYDTREGNLRDVNNVASNVMALSGGMYYVALDVNNLRRWLAGTIPAAGSLGPNVLNLNGFIVYFSDRRNNNCVGIPICNNAAAPGVETGEYGFEDVVNPADINGIPDGVKQLGEDINGNTTLETYGGLPANLPVGAALPLTAAARSWNTTVAATPVTAATLMVNRPIFFRRALKLIRGGIGDGGAGVSGMVGPGLTIAAENPVYVQGNYNASAASANVAPSFACSILADAVTLLSNGWVDVFSLFSPNDPSGRPGVATSYRMAIASGKTLSFQKPVWAGVVPDFGTDGGAHNFLRYLEDWNGANLNYRGSIVSLFMSRQAVGTYKCCQNVYGPPTRLYIFDNNFLLPALLPPGTPMFRDVNTLTFRQLLRPNQ